ncbi:hypothetical protein LXA24_17510, partial [Erwinia amylovora]|uniref:hypothetical protein n=1 Tax=Erwinia amylovora TaxID=552 RepID=UPI0020BE90E6
KRQITYIFIHFLIIIFPNVIYFGIVGVYNRGLTLFHSFYVAKMSVMLRSVLRLLKLFLPFIKAAVSVLVKLT